MPPGLTSPTHLFVVLTVALIVLGPEKLPEAARQVARVLGEIRRWSDSVSSEFRQVIDTNIQAADETPVGKETGAS